jgi:ATP-binding protein involved in chromosome partitioning
MPANAEVLEAARAVVDPELEVALGAVGMVPDASCSDGRAEVTLAVPVTAWPTASFLRQAIEDAVRTVPGVDAVAVTKRTMSEDERLALRHALRQLMVVVSGPQGHHGHSHGAETPRFLDRQATTRVLGISSGKGGVGKSSVTVNLAIALAKAGQRVGVLDADVYGFSVPKMLGPDHDPIILGDTVLPTAVHGVRCLSMGFFVPDEQPVIWRGPMLHKAIEQFVTEAFWGEPDFLLIDMPPGTGDVALTLSEVLPQVEIYVVTTPQPAAQRVAQRSAFAARKMKLAVRGVIENMSWFTGDDAKRYELFGAGGGQQLAHDLGVPLLGQVPLVPALREGGDEGRPITVSDPTSEASAAFDAIAQRVIAQGPARVYRQELRLG